MTSLPPSALTPPSAPDSEPPADAPPPPPRGRALWRPWTAWAVVATGFGATIFVGIFVTLIAHGLGAPTKHPPPGVNIGLTFFQDFAIVAAALAWARLPGPVRAIDFGLVATPLRRSAGLIVVVWLSFFAFSAAWTAALSLHQKDKLPTELGVNKSSVALALVLVLVTVVAPLAEEICFRGYFFGALRNWHGVWPAAIITGAVFGAVHLGSSPAGFVVPLAFFGMCLCLLYDRTKSLYPGIVTHALNNSVAFGVTQHWGWQIPATMAGSVVLVLLTARALGRFLGDGRIPGPPKYSPMPS